MSVRDAGGGIDVVVVLDGLQPLFARGLVEVLQGNGRPRLTVLAERSGALEHRAGRSASRALLLHESVGRLAWVSAIQAETAIIVLAERPSVALGMMLLAAGVSCLDMGCTEQVAVSAVRLAAGGQQVFVSTEAAVPREVIRERPRLTLRELQVLRSLSSGPSNDAVAQDLGITCETVKKHIRKLADKLNASTRRELVGLPTQWLDLDQEPAASPGDPLASRLAVA